MLLFTQVNNPAKPSYNAAANRAVYFRHSGMTFCNPTVTTRQWP